MSKPPSTIPAVMGEGDYIQMADGTTVQFVRHGHTNQIVARITNNSSWKIHRRLTHAEKKRR